MAENPIDELHMISDKLPLPVLMDIEKRIGDWMARGGRETDPYIHQQLRFARNVLASLEAY